MGGGEPLPTSVGAGFLESWRQVTDGRVLKGDWDVRRGGGKRRHPGQGRERKSSGGRKAQSGNLIFRMGWKDF